TVAVAVIAIVVTAMHVAAVVA
ncbi:hypothetical protein A2U01_0054204, partial [Trifolium medium]|nr:hypothetical protein [Trifolium medium]